MTNRRFFRTITIQIIIFFLTLPLYSEILSSSDKIDADWIVTIENLSREPYDAMVISANSAYRPESGQIVVESGEKVELKLIFTGDDKHSDEPLYIRLISDHPENPGLLTLGERAAPLLGNQTDRPTDAIVLEYYYTPNCSSCREFLEKEIPALKEELNLTITVDNINITTGEGLNSMNRRLSALGSSEKKIPILIANNVILAGEKKIRENLKELVIKISENEISSAVDITENQKSRSLNLTLLPIVLAGLLDGINPCAFSTLIFLLSWLTLAGRNRKEILITGIFFTSAVFLTYYIVGLGAFTALRSSESVPLVAIILKYSMALLMSVLGAIHIKDYFKVRAGKSGEITLQLSKERKKKIHSLIRGKARQTGLFAGSVVLGILVTIYELGCTGQVYLPTLMYMVRIEKGISSYLLLGLYNLGFILPLIFVFIAARFGLGSEKLTSWFKENLAAVKLLSAVFFILMAVLLVIL